MPAALPPGRVDAETLRTFMHERRVELASEARAHYGAEADHLSETELLTAYFADKPWLKDPT